MTATTKRTRASKTPAAAPLQVVPRPKLAPVTSIAEHHRKQIRQELLALMKSVERGEIIGFGYAIAMTDKSTRAGLAGTLAGNRHEAAGIFLHVAVSNAFKEVK